jgi:hypothetical protein
MNLELAEEGREESACLSRRKSAIARMAVWTTIPPNRLLTASDRLPLTPAVTDVAISGSEVATPRSRTPTNTLPSPVLRDTSSA